MRRDGNLAGDRSVETHEIRMPDVRGGPGCGPIDIEAVVSGAAGIDDDVIGGWSGEGKLENKVRGDCETGGGADHVRRARIGQDGTKDNAIQVGGDSGWNI